MQLRTNLPEPSWTFWERRTLNMHRVVGLSPADHRFMDAHSLDTELRATFARNFKRAWWRGIAYGAVVNVGALTLTPNDLKILVDEYENEKGTMQWVILLTGDAPKATGVHTWIEGFLSPVYRAVLQALSGSGYQIESVMKGKNGLMRLLTAVADARTRADTGHAAFQEFRDPFRNHKSNP
jgi:hypothetical protein